MDWGQTPTPGFLVDLETRERLEFQYNPSEITDEKTAHYATVRVPGLSHPKYQFVAGGERRIAFTLHLFKGHIQERIAWLQSLLYPEEAETFPKRAPYRVLLMMGDLYPGITCVIRDVRVQYLGLFDSIDLTPQRVEVRLNLGALGITKHFSK